MITPINNQPDKPAEELPGTLLAEPNIRDTRLIERAIRERWPIGEQYREAIVNRQIKIALDPLNSPRESTSAFRSLLHAERQNIDGNRLELEIDGLIGKRDLLLGPSPEVAPSGNVQVNVYLPDNGRGPVIDGYNSNGRH